MAVFRGYVYSKILELDTFVTVIYPERPAKLPLKTLYILHGMRENAQSWVDRTTITELFQDRDVAVVMPDGGREFYMNMKVGCRYEDYFAKELPEMCEHMFHLSPKREDRYLMGYSMGGYATARFALTHPETFGHACVVAGAIDIFRFTTEEAGGYQRHLESKAIFGDTQEDLAAADLFGFLDRFPEDAPKADWLNFCGSQDFRTVENKRFDDALRAKGFKTVIDDWDGDHDFTFCNSTIPRIIKEWFE